MSIIKLGNRLEPKAILDKVKELNPKSVLVMWIDKDGNPYLAFDDGVSMRDLAYYNSCMNIWTHSYLKGNDND
jgi:hypothetical protein